MGCARPWSLWLPVAVGALIVWLWPAPARAETESDESLPALHAPPDPGLWAGRPVTRTEVVAPGSRWLRPAQIRRVRPGEPLSGELARRALDELTDTGRYAAVRAE